MSSAKDVATDAMDVVETAVSTIVKVLNVIMSLTEVACIMITL